ncbi:MAG: YgiT-type zinc finger protein [Gammaproteobacteria bacterium]|nr:YgiT-type zinc finger protein [Gammaproteobacteria bacterium]
MQCAMCKQGETQPGRAMVALGRGVTTVVVKGVPVDVCGNCGEYYLSEEMADRVLAMAEEAVAHSAEIEMLRCAA